MKRLTYIFGVILLSGMFIIQACDSKNKKPTKVRSIGSTSEILVVLQNDELKDGELGNVLREYLGREQYGLMQAEPIFDLAFITVSNFSDMFHKHRNLLIIEFDHQTLETKVEAMTDRWSAPQRVIKITSPSVAVLARDLPNYAEGLIDDYSDAERKRILSVFRPSSKNKVTSAVAEKFNLNMTIPAGFYMAKSEPGFMWIRKEVTEHSQGLVIISEPYLDKAQFSKNSVVARTNRELLQYVPGPTEGSYMKISEEFIEASWKQVDGIETDYAVEIRGIWDVENDFMGGPMVSYTFLDTGNDNIITIMGYVYHPNKDKRNLLRQMEAIIYSVKPRPTVEKEA